jgi:hypothetical protein
MDSEHRMPAATAKTLMQKGVGMRVTERRYPDASASMTNIFVWKTRYVQRELDIIVAQINAKI